MPSTDACSVVCVVGGQQRLDTHQRPASHEKAGEAARDRKQTRFKQQLPDQLPPVRANRQADGHLLGARGSLREQQVRDVGARDEQHDARQAEEHQQRRPRMCVHIALPSRTGCELHALGHEPRHGLVTHVLLERGFDAGHDRVVRRIERGLRLCARDAGLQSREGVQPVGRSIRVDINRAPDHPPHRQRHEHARLVAQGRPGESSGCHADNRHAQSVDDDRPADHVSGAAERVLPIVETEDHRTGRVEHVVVGRGEQPAGRGREAQHRKVTARHHLALCLDGAAVMTEIHEHAIVGRNPGEALLLAFEIPEHRVADDDPTAAGAVAGHAAGLRTWRLQIHEFTRTGDRQGAYQDDVEEGEDRGVRADPERERQGRDRSHERRFQQRAARILQVRHGTSSSV